ncbi:unnamed protein product [Paramecium pentaurelia]|uniref:Phospholipid-transporting ATPase n=1 Tax=Paramecium pentaurelia TaxID=43138 RepID=A0A8S1SC89_9CILI|nr:unnamed protein product [Paramecium pentaurelia]
MNKVEDSTTKLLQTEFLQIEQGKESIQIVKDNENNSWKKKLKNVFVVPIQKCSRIIYLNGECTPINQQSNVIKNSKYNVITFLPKVLYEQFHQFINIFYLGLTISQFIQPFKVGFLIGYLGPLALVVTLSILKELYDDIKRHKRDRQINSTIYKRYLNGQWEDITSGQLQIGMIIKVNSNQRIPADILVLQASDEQVFIRTDQLDGETDWKLRKPVQYIQKKGLQNLDLAKCQLNCDCPQENIYDFHAVFQCEQQKELLSLENVMWASTVLANGNVDGIVIYNGFETRMAMNSRQPQTKFGKIDTEINYMSIMLFIAMGLLSIIITILSQPPLNALAISVSFVRYLILLSNIIPISMRVNVEFAKLIYCYKISIDQSIKGTIPRNSNIPESLGRIEYLLTDKTGTLTQNDMIFKKLSLKQQVYTYENYDEMKKSLQTKQAIGNVEDDAILRDLLLAIALCHNVTPIEENGERQYQASSPDEVALVKIAESLGITLKNRDQNSMIIELNGQTKKYEILYNFPFSSESKRMGILLKLENLYIFYLKGADAIMKQFLPETQRGFVDEECENLAREGLRTLVLTQKIITREYFEGWKKKYEQAQYIENVSQRLNKLDIIRKELEINMQFLGITGVEDKLQEDVCATLENIRNAGINVWMLTGDKIETAICIAISSGIKSATQEICLLKEIIDEETLQKKLKQFETKTNQLLVIDGTSLQTAFKKEEFFFRIATQAQSVVCCRCSPTQKALVTECIKKYTHKIIACIGDGGNDVGMIQSADVGIGIEGKEGKQAALASDFSILKFKYLNSLLLWHGRLSYKRSALLSQFVTHRGLIISMIQTVFMCTYFYLSLSIFSSTLILGYATIYTMFPVFSIIFDEDVVKKVALEFPPLYKSLQKSRDLNQKTFLIWCWKATYQGTIIMILAQLLYQNVFLYIETAAFTSLIITEYCMIFSELNSLHIVMFISTIGSTIFYVLTMVLIPETLVVGEVLNGTFWINTLIIVLFSWCPIFLVQWFVRIKQPNDYEKIMKQVKDKQKIKTNIFT